MANSQLQGNVIKLPDNIIKHLYLILKNNPNNKESKGYKRINFLLKNRELTYEQLKRIKNYFDNLNDENFDELEYLYNGGEQMMHWVNNILQQLRDGVDTSKFIKTKSGMDNQYKKDDVDNFVPNTPNIRKKPDFMSTKDLFENNMKNMISEKTARLYKSILNVDLYENTNINEGIKEENKEINDNVLDKRLIDIYKNMFDINLNENKIYPMFVLNTIKKFEPNLSNDDVKKIQLVGLFRNSKIFKKIGDIISYFKNGGNMGEISNIIDDWYTETIGNLVNNPKSDFYKDSKSAVKYLNEYMETVSDETRAFTIESGPNSLKNMFDFNDDDTENDKLDKRDVRQDDLIETPNKNIVVTLGDSFDKCVMYGRGQTWCISSFNDNYLQYRSQSTIYFVKQLNLPKEDDKHNIVLLCYTKGGYGIADRTNTGNFTGSNMYSWGDVEKIIPNLKGLQEYFKVYGMSKYDNYMQYIKYDNYGDNIIDYIVSLSKDENGKPIVIDDKVITPKDIVNSSKVKLAIELRKHDKFEYVWNLKNENPLANHIIKSVLSTGLSFNQKSIQLLLQ